MGKVTPELYYAHRTLGQQSLYIMTKYTGKNAAQIDTMIIGLGTVYKGNIFDGYKLADRELHLIPSDYLTFSLADGLKVYSEDQVEVDFVKADKPFLTPKRFCVLAVLLSVLAVSLAVYWQVHDVSQNCMPASAEKVADVSK